MRITLLALTLISSLTAAASARELDESYHNTSLSSAPVGSTSASRVERRGRKEATAPTKYDVSFPVRDHGRVVRDHGAI